MRVAELRVQPRSFPAVSVQRTEVVVLTVRNCVGKVTRMRELRGTGVGAAMKAKLTGS